MPRAAANRVTRPPTRFQPYRRCAQRPPRFSFFLSLPAELRNHIYGHLLDIPQAIDVGSVWSPLPPLNLGILRVCRQIGQEAAHYFYSTNTFCFVERCDDFNDDNDDIDRNPGRRWLLSIGDTNARSLLNLQIRLRDERQIVYYEQILREVAARSPNLRRLALIGEKHVSSRMRLHAGHIVQRWEPNQVVALCGCSLEALRPALRLLGLKVLTLAGQYDETDVLDRLCADLRCRVQVINNGTVKRQGHCGFFVLWNQESKYEAIPTPEHAGEHMQYMGEVYRLDNNEARAVEVEPGDDRGRKGVGEEEDDGGGGDDDDGVSDSAIVV